MTATYTVHIPASLGVGGSHTADTAEMSQDLRAELERLGWGGKLDRVIWGRRVSGDAHGVTIERGGVTRHYAGPFSCVRRGDQIAIVRFG